MAQTSGLKQEDTINIKETISYYSFYWKWIILSVILCVSTTAFYLLKMSNQYEVKTSVLIKDDKDNSGISETAVLDDLGLASPGKNNIDNETEILKSADLVKSTIKATNFHIQYFTKSKFAKLRVYPSPVNLSITNISLDTIKQPIHVEISNNEDSRKMTVEYLGETYSRSFTKYPCLFNFPFGQITMTLNSGQATYNKLYIDINNPESMAVGISNSINIAPSSKNSSVLNISYVCENINAGKEFLRKLVDIYNFQAVQDKNQISYNTALFIDDRLKSLSVELSSVEKDVEHFKTANKITDISSEAQLFLDQTGDYETKVNEVETQLNVIKYVEDFVNNEKNKNHLIPNLGITDQGLSTLIDKYNELFLQKEQIQRASTTSNPVLQNIIEQLSNMKSGIKTSIINVRKTLLISKRVIDQGGRTTTNKIQQIPRIEREFVEIKRQQQIKETLYLFLLQKREETSLSLAATAPKAKIVSLPRSNNAPVSPKKSIILLSALLLGLIIPVLIIYVKDLFQTTIKSRDDLENLLEAPILGEICEDKTGNPIIVSPNENSTTIELFRSLRNDLTFILSDPNKKVITITSTVSGEGKTFTCINLACTFALIEKKVLLVGLDIRNQSLARYFSVQKKQGITNYLAMGGNVDDLIEKSRLNPNLDIIYAGIIPPNPNELLNKKELDELFSELRKRYEYILIDTAPVGIISDTFLINRISDITLFITREKVTNKECIPFINDLYVNNRLTNLYVILNGTDIGRKRYGYYKKEYYYGYYKKSEKKENSLFSFKNYVSKIKKD